VQVDPIKPTMKAPGTERFKLEYEELLSNFGFKFNLRRYIQVAVRNPADPSPATAPPLRFEQVWADSGIRAFRKGKRQGSVAFWKPVPPPGYVAVGHVATPGHSPPPVTAVVCLRADLAMVRGIGSQTQFACDVHVTNTFESFVFLDR